MAGPQYVYVMKGLSKTYPGGKQVLKDIWLSLLSRRQDRHCRRQRRGQVDLMQIMAGHGQGIHRRGLGGRRRAHGVSAAGAAARSVQGRARQCDGRRGAKSRRWSTASTRSPRIIPTKPPTRWRGCRTRSRPRACGISTARSRGDGRAALPATATPRSQTFRAAKSAAWRCASCCCERPTCCCSTSRPTIWTPNRWPGWSTPARIQGLRRSWSPMTAISSTMSPAGFWSSTAARAFRTKAITPPCWSGRKSA